MSEYTTQVRYICEKAAGLDESVGISSVDKVIDAALPLIFDFDFPIWDAAYKPILEKKILMHYYMSEIGQETVALWKMWLRVTLNEIMPYYNKLYDITMKEFVPANQIDYKKEITDINGQTQMDTGTQVNTLKDTGTQSVVGSNTGGQTIGVDDTGTQETATAGEVHTDTNVTHTGTQEFEETTDPGIVTTTTNTGQQKNREEWDHSRTPDLTGKTKVSDTPQGGLAGIESDNYLSRAEIATTTGTEREAGYKENIRTDMNLESEVVRTGKDVVTTVRTDDLTDHPHTDESHSDYTTRTDNLHHDTTRTDDLHNESTRTDDLTHENTRKDNLKKSIDSTRSFIETMVGTTNAYQVIDVIEKLRGMIDNIDIMIISDLSPCFMQIF